MYKLNANILAIQFVYYLLQSLLNFLRRVPLESVKSLPRSHLKSIINFFKVLILTNFLNLFKGDTHRHGATPPSLRTHAPVHQYAFSKNREMHIYATCSNALFIITTSSTYNIGRHLDKAIACERTCFVL